GVARSLVANGAIVTKRDGSGSDAELVGATWAPTEVAVTNARRAGPFALDCQGFQLCASPTALAYDDFYDEDLILRKYYARRCAALVKIASRAPPWSRRLTTTSGAPAASARIGPSRAARRSSPRPRWSTGTTP
ncbi:unnamed protein product, partial [Prorocentrum cordatum]